MKRVSLKVGRPLPSSTGRCADAYHDIRELRLAMKKEVDAIEEREKEIKQYILDNLSASDDTGASGRYYRAQITTQDEPTVTDWDDFWDYVFEEDRTDLVQKSIARKAVKEMQEAGERIPGVTKITVKKVSITKIA